MIDRTTGQPLRVSTDGTVPYIRVPYSQLDELRQLLNSHGIPHQVKENVVSLSGGPFMAVVYLGFRADVTAIQAVLDSVRP